MREIVIIMCLCSAFILNGCKSNVKMEEEKYKEYETQLDSCCIYKMVFDTGDYLFRHALSGNCSSLTAINYVADYKSFLSNHKAEIRFIPNHFIQFEYYKELNIDSLTINEIASFTKEFTGRNVLLSKNWDQGFILKLE